MVGPEIAQNCLILVSVPYHREAGYDEAQPQQLRVEALEKL